LLKGWKYLFDHLWKILLFFLLIKPGAVSGQLTISLQPANTTCGYNNGVIFAVVAGGTTPYSFSDNGGSSQPGNLFTGLGAGTHVIQVKDATGLSRQASITLNNKYQSPKFTIPAETPPTDCNAYDGKVTIAATGGSPPYKYSTDGSNFQSSNTFNTLSPGYYLLTVRDNNFCASSFGFSFTDHCAVAVKFDYSPVVCAKEGYVRATPNPAGALPYVYSLDGTNYRSDPDFEGLNAGQYHLYTRDNNGLVSINAFLIKSHCDLPVLSTATKSRCNNNDGTISVTVNGGNAPFFYSIAGQNYQTDNTLKNLAPGTYTVQVTDAGGNIGTQTDVVVGQFCPVLNATSTPTACTSATGTITITNATGTAPIIFSLDGVNFKPDKTFAGLAAGNYTVTSKDANQIITTTTVAVATASGPTLSASADAASCSGNDGAIIAAGNGGVPPLHYQLNNGGIQPGGRFAGLTNGIYTVKVIDANGCSAQQDIQVPVNNSIVLDAGNNLSVCDGGSVTLEGFSSAPAQWSPSSGLSDVSVLEPLASPATTTKYYLSAKAGICSAVDSVLVTVFPLPIASAGPDTSICYLQNIKLQGSGGTGYSWTPSTFLDNAAAKNPTLVHPTQNITYQLTVTDAHGCISANAASVNITVLPEAQVFAGNDTSILAGQPFALHAVDINNSGFNYFQWSPAFGLDDPSLQNPLTTLDFDQTYSVTAGNTAGCTATDDIIISVYKTSDIIVPNAFTPNNDGHNDVLHVRSIGIRDLHYFTLYNRWGQQIFKTQNGESGWDGRINGQDQPAGTYVWMAEAVDYSGKIIRRKGVVVLIR
jgi:gliding motility-associated-like protein